MAAAVRAYGDLGIRELLDLFGVLLARGAFVFVERHGFLVLVSLISDASEAAKMQFRFVPRDSQSFPNSMRRTLAMASTLRRASTAALAAEALGTSIWTTAMACPWGTR